MTFIKEEWLSRGVVQTSRQELVGQIQEAQAAVSEQDRPRGLMQQGNLWKKKDLIFVPDAVKAQVLQEFHDSMLAGHPGSTKTVNLIQREYWWPTLYSDVRAYVRGCDRCQRTKALRQTRA